MLGNMKISFPAAGLQTQVVDFVLRRCSEAFPGFFHFSSLNIEEASEESRERHRHWQARVGEGMQPCLFISSAQWSQYLAVNLHQKKEDKSEDALPLAYSLTPH